MKCDYTKTCCRPVTHRKRFERLYRYCTYHWHQTGLCKDGCR